MTRRTVVSGIGVVAPTGVGQAAHWAATLAGECGIAPLPDADRLPITAAGRVTGFDPAEQVPNRLRVQTDRWTWMALAAGAEALADARLDPAAEPDPYALAALTSSASGGNEFGQREIQSLYSDGPRAVTAYQSIAWFYAASTGQLSIRHGLKGPCGVVVSDAAGGLDAAAQAARLIRRGTGAVLVGGTEAPLSPYALVCQNSQETVSRSGGYRPFDARACGGVPGEGGAILVLEERERARARDGVTLYAELAGTAATHDAHRPTGPAPEHRQLARAMRLAISRAGLTPAGIDVVFADGSGDPGQDAVEAAAVHEVFAGAPAQVPVTVPKTMTGRLCSGGAALDLAWAALALHHDTIPPTVNVDPFSTDHGLDLVTEPRTGAGLRAALVVARGVGGFNSAAVLRRAVA
ncbi:beta-ketoacyl synthase N-terminal-like domain-containing protein [Actinomadura kijaniata]|uniref:beta-ketoacyl synthase N-terminal-like domain-containing protein n=1 Tax=Actinomadura kijaniata TaxID=46161 RepID=UPI0008368388|nr:beta-ketoacyl synthase N-terminal-like domain-containing protein [Actinomadura kijaniata]